MNVGEKRRVEALLKERAATAREAVVSSDNIKPPRALVNTVKRLLAKIAKANDELAEVYEEARDIGFEISTNYKGRLQVVVRATHPQRVANEDRAADVLASINAAVTEAIIVLWSSKEFDLRGAFAEIDGAS